MDFTEALALTLKELRSHHRVSQEKLAEVINSHQVYISEIEKGKKVPSIVILNNIAQCYNMPLSELISKVEEKLL